MATFTSQILVGNAHPYDGGIYGITHFLYLSENSRPAWILQGAGDARKRKVTWIPTLENMLGDALLMVGLYVVKDETLLKMKEKYFHNENSEHIELYRDVKPEHLEEMYDRCRQLEDKRKLMFSVFAGSSIEKQLPTLRKYHFDIEVCLSTYRKEYSVWSGKQEERGDL
ncbi:hypothetical protein J2S74_000715 [Evansella vedderi]|uniref:Uncharacterized protein n=1 Tax=Evansella vedderi TaxID=38282 RepID=A0ABT9ZS83_9BACI|nr:hypothetical protein [Evansella vedderi]MDQ0253343.1 hypothetical protein [Evansella vedderi]